MTEIATPTATDWGPGPIPVIDWESAEFHSGIDRAVKAVAAFQGGPGVVRSQRGIEVVGYDAAAALVRNNDFNLGMEARMNSIGVDGVATRESFLNFLFSRDGEHHLRARRACAPWFSSSSAERIREDVRNWVDRWLDDAVASAEDFDFLWEIANKLPATLYCLLVGAPLTDAPLIQHLSEECMLLSAPPLPGHRERLEKAAAETKAYLLGLADQRRSAPGEDLISYLVAAMDRGEIDEDDMLAITFNALVGSTDTTAAQLCCNLEALAWNPEQWRLLRREPERVPHAVMELMRYHPGAWSITRSAKAPMTYKGLELTADVTIFPLIFAANNDPTVYEDPRRLDVTRPHPKQPLNFGAGVHGCLGRMFSLLEQQEVLSAVLRKWDSFTVLESEFTGAMFFLVPQRFRVAFTPAG